MERKLVFKNEYIRVYFTISKNKGKLFIDNIEYEDLAEISFDLNKSFELTYKQATRYFEHLSNYDISVLLEKTDYKLIHLKHYDAYVIVKKEEKNPTIYIPEDKIKHVIGSKGSSINAIASVNGYNKIIVKKQ